MWSALGIRRHKRGQSERDQKGQALARKRHPTPPPTLTHTLPTPCWPIQKPAEFE